MLKNGNHSQQGNGEIITSGMVKESNSIGAQQGTVCETILNSDILCLLR